MHERIKLRYINNGVILLFKYDDIHGNIQVIEKAYANRECARYDYGQSLWHYIIQQLGLVQKAESTDFIETNKLINLNIKELVAWLSESIKKLSQLNTVQSVRNRVINILAAANELKGLSNRYPKLV